MTAPCRSCGAPMEWAETSTGKRMPLDPEPVPDGNVVLDVVVLPGSSLQRNVARVLAAGETRHPDRFRYRSHFATCPSADRHRKPRAAAPSSRKADL